ncbi:hypothetical protein ABTH55_18835, partial [Acinetobacter baumannii]
LALMSPDEVNQTIGQMDKASFDQMKRDPVYRSLVEDSIKDALPYENWDNSLNLLDKKLSVKDFSIAQDIGKLPVLKRLDSCGGLMG